MVLNMLGGIVLLGKPNREKFVRRSGAQVSQNVNEGSVVSDELNVQLTLGLGE